jgi:hypothetical protein
VCGTSDGGNMGSVTGDRDDESEVNEDSEASCSGW